MAEVISVRFRGGSKNYYFDPKGLQVEPDTYVVVETAQGIEYARCVEGNHEVPDQSVVQPLRGVARIATDNDHKAAAYNRKREQEAFAICEKKIAAHHLEMKLVSVECGFEGNKIIFFFTAEGRVDFRELVRDLASVFRARIELRQIGVRDEAKMLGGIGICGRPLCCSQFLDEFIPVSIKMAKTQNLSLNPTKISGTCGRLMCCLKYEQNAYEDAAKRMPKLESFVQTPDGPGNVKSVDLLRETVKVSLDSAGPNDLFKTYRSCEIKLLRNGKGSREGIEIPDRPARYVEEREEEGFEMPVLSTPFYMEHALEDAPVREKMSHESGSDGKPRRKHRGGRRRSGSKPQDAAPPPRRPDEGRPKAAKPQQPRPEGKSAGAEGGDTKRRRPYYRNRRRSKGGPPKGD